ncbi:MAG: glycosyltransferase [Alphaproteobacteria bacterium]|nr:glycosyltransferase [Alphaproteobacteria bacterium]
MPLVSIIIPVYNVEKFLSFCLDSVMAQTFTDFEVLCIDDGSTDGSAKILEKYAKKDKRFKIIHQENSGVSKARNTGLREALGQYIYFLDSDDTIAPKLLETALYFMQQYQAEMVCFDFQKVMENNFPYQAKEISIPEIKAKYYVNPLAECNHKFPAEVWTKLYDRHLLEKEKFIEHISFEDVPFTYSILARRPKIVMIDEKLYFYTLRHSSLSKQEGKVSHILDYHTGVKALIKLFDVFNEVEKKAVLHFLLPDLLKQQYNRCLRASDKNKNEMLEAFANELRDLDQAGLLRFRYHKFLRWFAYRRLIKKEK